MTCVALLVTGVLQTQNLATELVQKLPAVAIASLIGLAQTAPAMAADAYAPPPAMTTTAPAAQVCVWPGCRCTHSSHTLGLRLASHTRSAGGAHGSLVALTIPMLVHVLAARPCLPGRSRHPRHCLLRAMHIPLSLVPSWPARSLIAASACAPPLPPNRCCRRSPWSLAPPRP